MRGKPKPFDEKGQFLIDPFGLSPDLPGGGGGGGGENSPEQKVSKWEWLHLGLDIAGFIPALGLVPDLINAVLYAVEGDSTNAALSAAAAIPFVGDVVGGSKLGLKAGRLLSKGTRNSKVIQKVVKYTSNASEFAIKAGKAGLDTANRAFQSVKVTAKAIITEGKIAKSGNNLRKIVKNSKIGKAASKVWGKVAKKGGKKAGKGVSKADLGNKLDYQFGKAGGNKHNIDRANGLKEEMNKLGFDDIPENRAYFEQYYNDVLNDSSNLVGKPQPASYIENGVTYHYTVTTRESFLMGKSGGAKVTTHWDGNRLLTIKIGSGKQTRYHH